MAAITIKSLTKSYTGDAKMAAVSDMSLDIADGFVWLSSDDAEWVTGIALTVDGGLTAGIYRG